MVLILELEYTSFALLFNTLSLSNSYFASKILLITLTLRQRWKGLMVRKGDNYVPHGIKHNNNATTKATKTKTTKPKTIATTTTAEPTLKWKLASKSVTALTFNKSRDDNLEHKSDNYIVAREDACAHLKCSNNNIEREREKLVNCPHNWLLLFGFINRDPWQIPVRNMKERSRESCWQTTQQQHCQHFMGRLVDNYILAWWPRP